MSKKKQILLRIKVVYSIFILLTLGIIIKMIYIQFVEGKDLRSRAELISYKKKVVEPSRGDVCATDGRVLSTSVPYFEIRMDLLAGGLTDEVFAANVDSLAICLSNLFRNKSWYAYRSELKNARKFDKSRRFYKIGPRKVNYVELQQVRKFPLFRLPGNRGGFIPVQSYQRILTHGSMASRTIGNVNEGGAEVGIEGAFNYALKGKEGSMVMQRKPGNVWVEVKSTKEVETEDGVDVITAIDVDIQDVAEVALRRSLSRHGADHGCAVLMEVETGDIKAISNLKRREDGSYSEEYNYAIGEATEPGSTLKIATLIALLEDGYINLDDTVNTGDGQFKIYDRIITDSRKGGHGRIPIKEAVEVSSNIAMVKLVNKYYKGKEKSYVDRLCAMRLNHQLQLQIPGEAQPYIKYPGEKFWSGMSLPMMSMGYEMRLTPLQTLVIYNAIANGGKMVRPRFVKSLKRHGQTIQTFPTEVIVSSICSRSTIKKVNETLTGVVENGTAKNLQNSNYQIAGKTGTAQLARGSAGYKHQGVVSYQASFVGYFPADNPKYSCIVVVNSPSNSVYYGNVVAGPVFKEIADKVYATNPEWFSTIDRSGVADMPQGKNGRATDLFQVLDELDIPYSDKVNGAVWAAPKRTENEVEVRKLEVARNLIPNVVGMGLKDALFLLENSGVRVRFSGYGAVRSQSVQPGTRAVRGAVVFLEMTSS